MSNRRSLKSVVLLIFAVAVLTMVVVSTVSVAHVTNVVINDMIKWGTVSNVEGIADRLDGDLYEEFLENPVEGELYDFFVNELNDIREVVGASYLYTLRASGKNLKIMIDGLDDPTPINSDTSTTQYEDVEPAFDGDVLFSDLVNDPVYGDYVSAFAPIKNSKGEVVGVLGLDSDPSQMDMLKSGIFRKELPVLIAIIVVLGVVLLVRGYFYLSKKLDPLLSITEVTKHVANGDLDKAKKVLSKSTVKDNTEIGLLYDSSRVMIDSLENLVARMSDVIESLQKQSVYLDETFKEVSVGAEHVTGNMGDMSSAVDSEAKLVQNFNVVMNEFTELYNQTAVQGNAIINSTRELMNESSIGIGLMNDSKCDMETIYNIITDAVEEMKRLNEDNKKIVSLVTAISDIAEQTNLLSLNAAIEAARAGESSRGFSVVASEIGKLAKNAAQSVTDIKSIVSVVTANSVKMVSTMQSGLDKVKHGRDNLIRTGDTFNKITESLGEMNSLSNDMKNQLSLVSSKEVVINRFIKDLVNVSKTNASSIEEVTSATEEINASIQSLSRSTKELNTSSNSLNEINKLFKL